MDVRPAPLAVRPGSAPLRDLRETARSSPSNQRQHPPSPSPRLHRVPHHQDPTLAWRALRIHVVVQLDICEDWMWAYGADVERPAARRRRDDLLVVDLEQQRARRRARACDGRARRRGGCRRQRGPAAAVHPAFGPAARGAGGPPHRHPGVPRSQPPSGNAGDYGPRILDSDVTDRASNKVDASWWWCWSSPQASSSGFTSASSLVLRRVPRRRSHLRLNQRMTQNGIQDSFSKGINGTGFLHGAHVGIVAKPSPEFVAGYFAIHLPAFLARRFYIRLVHFMSGVEFLSEESRRIQCTKCANFHIWICIKRSKTGAQFCQALISFIKPRMEMDGLKPDFQPPSRYAHDEEAADDQEESRWKYIHGDVFRFPNNRPLFFAALGTSTQLFALILRPTSLLKDGH